MGKYNSWYVKSPERRREGKVTFGANSSGLLRGQNLPITFLDRIPVPESKPRTRRCDVLDSKMASLGNLKGVACRAASDVGGFGYNTIGGDYLGFHSDRTVGWGDFPTSTFLKLGG